ncbi:hypothetical protein [Pseudomonas sp. BIGb0164]|uniref:hypothetical protein n=1 Tax=Pseudomonas sp. BIGb0164 TaxID=2940605 RepID=UPI002169D88B|nr:hypothetical protein [Pseudomonas sp. BIGb0164]MCS4250648.1 hypothetical protein [Pseudomonas sp. BIGb0164]
MSKRAIHYDDWDGGIEADQDHPETLFCGTDIGDPEMSPNKDRVTCKRCLKILAAAKADRALEDQKYKADLYDEVWQKARDMGFSNVTMALSNLAEHPAPVAVVPELTTELRWILGQMCFQHIHTAQALRLMGHQIARKAEDEQAVTIYWMLSHYLKDPANWRRNASAELKESAPAE